MFLKMAKGSKSAAEFTELVRFLEAFNFFVFLKKNRFFWKWNLNFLKSAKGNKLAVECDWNSNISQIVQNLFSFENKKRRVFLKRIWIISKKSKRGKVASECDWNSRISQNVQKLGFSEKKSWVLPKRTGMFIKLQKVAKFF